MAMMLGAEPELPIGLGVAQRFVIAKTVHIMFRTLPQVFVLDFKKVSPSLDIINHKYACIQLKGQFLHEGAGRK